MYFCSVGNILWSCANIQIFSTISKSSQWYSNRRINVNNTLITSRHLWMTKHMDWFKPDHEVQHGIIASEKRGLLRSTSAGSSLRSDACMVQMTWGKQEQSVIGDISTCFCFYSSKLSVLLCISNVPPRVLCWLFKHQLLIFQNLLKVSNFAICPNKYIYEWTKVDQTSRRISVYILRNNLDPPTALAVH